MKDARIIIETNNLTKIYGQGTTAVKALQNISLNIQGGGFVAIMGPSGSGKSTLLHLLGGLDQPTSGRYVLDGVIVNDMDDDSLAEVRNQKIGFVFQQFNLLPRTTALDNVALPLTYGKERNKDMHERALQALRTVELEDRADHRPNELSGGEQQRIAVARALINDPSIILADEPTGNLDTKAGAEIMTIFEKLNKEGRTIILITHERYIADYAKRIIHLQDGTVVSDEAVSDDRPVAPQTELGQTGEQE